MKAESSIATGARASRNTVYSRPTSKRGLTTQPTSPSCHGGGIQKSRQSSKTSVGAYSPRKVPSYTPNTRLALEYQRQRQAQLITLEREVRGLLEEEYRQDVTAYMHQVELLTMSSPASMDMQPEIQWHMRACLVEFLIEVHLNFQLRPETLYLTCNIVDRYVSRRVVYKKHYQLVGCAALWIAAKFEDAKERVPTVRDLAEICRDEYDETAFIQMEGHVLATIAWRVGHPTAEAWLRVACVGTQFEEGRVQHVARFLMEITLFHREYVAFPPSVIAQAALLLARYTLNKSRRPFEETESVITVVQLLDSHLSDSLDQLSQMLVKKYSYSYYSKASTHIVHWYLQGKRYVYVPPSIVPVSSSTLARSNVPSGMVTPTMGAVSTPKIGSVHGPAVPVTPTNKLIPRVVQAWDSVSSTTSTSSATSTSSTDSSANTPNRSGSGSDTDISSSFSSAFSEFTDCTDLSSSDAELEDGDGDDGAPLTPSTSASAGVNVGVGVSLEPLNLHSNASQSMIISHPVPPSHSHSGHGHSHSNSSSNKENVHVVQQGQMEIDAIAPSDVAVASATAHAASREGANGNGKRSRKSSLEVVHQNIPQEQQMMVVDKPVNVGLGLMQTMDAATLDMCSASPASREATYVPRVALAHMHKHSLSR